MIPFLFVLLYDITVLIPHVPIIIIVRVLIPYVPEIMIVRSKEDQHVCHQKHWMVHVIRHERGKNAHVRKGAIKSRFKCHVRAISCAGIVGGVMWPSCYGLCSLCDVLCGLCYVAFILCGCDVM